MPVQPGGCAIPQGCNHRRSYSLPALGNNCAARRAHSPGLVSSILAPVHRITWETVGSLLGVGQISLRSASLAVSQSFTAGCCVPPGSAARRRTTAWAWRPLESRLLFSPVFRYPRFPAPRGCR